MLDEPTAALDVRGEARFYQRFFEITAGLTTVVISHRFATVRQADTICVLDGGRITERGSHDELVAAGGTYADMYQLQAGSFGAEAIEWQAAEAEHRPAGPAGAAVPFFSTVSGPRRAG